MNLKKLIFWKRDEEDDDINDLVNHLLKQTEGAANSFKELFSESLEEIHKKGKEIIYRGNPPNNLHALYCQIKAELLGESESELDEEVKEHNEEAEEVLNSFIKLIEKRSIEIIESGDFSDNPFDIIDLAVEELRILSLSPANSLVQ